MGKNTMHKSQTKLFIFMIGLFVFVVKPVMETAHLLVDWDHEITQIDFDKDLDEKEKQEKERNEKDWIHNKETVVTYTEESFNFILGYGTQKPYLDFVLEIPIPPPELV